MDESLFPHPKINIAVTRHNRESSHRVKHDFYVPASAKYIGHSRNKQTDELAQLYLKLAVFYPTCLLAHAAMFINVV